MHTCWVCRKLCRNAVVVVERTRARERERERAPWGRLSSEGGRERERERERGKEHAAGRREDEKDSSTLLQHMVDLQHGKHKDTAREAGLYVNHHVANATQQGDEVAWVQGCKRKRSDRDPENHTDHGDGEDEVKMEDKREGSRGPPSNAAVNANREGASDVDLEEQRRFENETEEERALQEEFEQDRALHEEWVQKTIDDYFADAEEEQPGPSRQRPGRQQEEGAKHHADAITMAFGRWSLGTAAGGASRLRRTVSGRS